MKGENPILAGETATSDAAKLDFAVTASFFKQLDPGSQEMRDNHIHIRGLKSVYQTCWTFQADGKMVRQNEVVVVNIILSAKDMTGPMWGSFEHLDDQGVSTWKGIFHGNRRLVGGDIISTIHDVGLGSGPNEGFLFQYTIQAINIDDPSVSNPFTGSGFMQAIATFEL